MLNLIMKDLLIQKKTLVISVLFSIIYMFAFQHSGDFSAIAIIIPSLITYLLMMNACAYDDKNRADILLNSLPIDRDDIIVSKYLSAYIFLLIGIAITVVVSCFVKFAGINNVSIFNLKYILCCIIMNTILVSVFLPVYFKFGNTRARYFNIAFFMIVFSMSAALASYFRKGKFPMVVTYFINKPIWLVAALLIGAALIMLLISMLLAMKFYLNKDL